MSEVQDPVVAPEPGADASPEPEVTPELTLDEVEAISKEDKEPEPEVEESEAESPPAGEAEAEEKTSDPFKERIDKLTANWRETQRALQQREQELAELQKQLDEAPKPIEEVKTLADFDYDEGQFQAYVLDRSTKIAREEARLALKEVQSEQTVEKQQTEYAKREQQFAESVKDYHELVYDPNLKISAPMAEAIKVLEEGPELAYYLAKNPDEAAEIAGQGAVQAAVSMAELRSKLVAEKSKAKKEVSDAPPPPPKKIGGSEPGRKVSTTSPDSDKLSDDEWFKREAARNSKARG